MATIDGIGLAEPSTITKSLAAALIQRNGSNTYQEVMVIGDPDSTTSSAIAKVVNGTPASTAWGLVTREAAPSGYLTVTQSTVGQTTATVLISSAATTPYISAYTITSTEAGPISGGFFAGSTMLWPVTLWGDGGRIHQTVAVSQPGFIFLGQASRPVSFNITSGTTGTYAVGLTYRAE